MDNSLEKSSEIIFAKSKFFIYRMVSYFSFLLIPILVPKLLLLDRFSQLILMICYVLFMISQWFLLGKEIDYRLKIYFRVNSSIDRVVYRLFLGMCFIILYFNMLSLLPSKWIYNSFWITWCALGLFYSWPTRGKIIRESVSTNFTEFKYLDRFEKTLVSLTVVMFFFSMPDQPTLTDIEALKLFFDPLEKISSHYWNFVTVNYFPFKKYPDLFRLALSVHFYYITFGLFTLTFYALLRYFVTRRLALLGVFALISSWSICKMMANNYGSTLLTTYGLIWVWSFLWVAKSGTYRSGLFLGLIGYLGAIINQSLSFLIFFQVFILFFFFLKEHTMWYRRQVIRYTSLGIALVCIVLITHDNSFSTFGISPKYFLDHFLGIFDRKAFFILSILGFVVYLLKIFNSRLLSQLQIDNDSLRILGISFVFLFLYSLIFDSYLMRDFSLIWPIALLSLFPLELIFQSISRLRSRRNMIYLIYIVICLLDSHFEGRIKIFLRFLDS